jgi:PAS domain-containing protein
VIEVMWIVLLIVPLLLAFGVAVVRLKLNITKRKQAEHRLFQESEKNKALLQHASDGIAILDENANVIEVSDSFCAMLGYSRDEMIGMNLTNWDCGSNSQNELMAAFRQHWESQTHTAPVT